MRLAFLALLCSFSAFGQGLPDQYKQSLYQIDTIQQPHFYGDVYQTIRNAEYFTPLTKGYTGLALLPEVVYRIPAKQYCISIGGQLSYYFGEESTTILPVVQFQYTPSQQWKLMLGRIQGGLSHNLAEQLYRYDNHYFNPIEYGFQAIHSSYRLHSDTWINWQNFIFPNDSEQEEFYVGNSTSLFLSDSSDILQFSIPAQGLMFHRGGQIDSNSNPVLAVLQGMGGFTTTIQQENWKLSASAQVFGHRKMQGPSSGTNAFPYQDGNAQLYWLQFSNAWLTVRTSYWQAEEFATIGGESLYGSVADYNTRRIFPSRQLITSHLVLQKTIKSALLLQAKIDSYYSLDQSSFDYSYGISARYLFVRN